MLRGRIGADEFPWPCGTYVNRGEFRHIMMAMDTRFGPDGLEYSIPEETPRTWPRSGTPTST